MPTKFINWLIRKTLPQAIPDGNNRKEKRENKKMYKKLIK